MFSILPLLIVKGPFSFIKISIIFATTTSCVQGVTYPDVNLYGPFTILSLVQTTNGPFASLEFSLVADYLQQQKKS